jgi:hypothetical protein
MSSQGNKPSPLYQRALGLVVYILFWCGLIYGGKTALIWAITPSPEIDIRELPPDQYDEAVKRAIEKAKTMKRNEHFAVCMDQATNQASIMNCLSRIQD